MSKERPEERPNEGVSRLMGSGEVCPGCDEEITVSQTALGDQVELTCRCGCSLAAA